MSDAIKWALLVAGALALIAIIIALPFVQYIDFNELGKSVDSVVTICSPYLESSRGLVNLFLSDFGINLVTGLMVYWICRPFALTSIKILTWIYHFIFK